jgi:hypothetical protein
MECVYQYVQALQALIYAGANVRMMLRWRPVAVLAVEVKEELGLLEVGYITAASPCEQFVLVSLATEFTVAFDDWPKEVVKRGWHRSRVPTVADSTPRLIEE